MKEEVLRVAVVGARRVRQGLGPFVCRELVRAGAEITGVLGRSEGSAGAAAEALQRESGIRTRAFPDLEALLAAEPVDALAILTPHAQHAPYLEAALERGLHVLCEKPLVWGLEAPARRTRELLAGFERAGLELTEVCQWPRVLPAFEALHPGSLERPPRRFAMRLAPESSSALEMLVDCLHHPLSVLQRLAPALEPAVEAPRMRFRPPDPGSGREARLEVDFRYGRGGGAIAVELALEGSPLRPRPAGLGWDGRWAERSVRAPDYAIYLAAGERQIPVRDPLEALIESFVEELRAARQSRAASAERETRRREIAGRMEVLEALAGVCRAEGYA